ncbi:MAG: 3TM-type holin [Gemmatimonadales bacterium]|nr:3TM-type holin [Gemmatimonadales bacterium]
MNDLLKLAPTILGFLGGPAGGLAGAGLQWLAGQFGAKDTTVGAIKDALAGLTPADTIRLRELDIEFQKFAMENGIKIDLAQIEVNKVEAASTNWLIAGWRPFTGWTCAAGLAYVAILEPFARFITQVGFAYAGDFPVIDTSLTMQILIGMLGLGGLRSFEKTKKVARS